MQALKKILGGIGMLIVVVIAAAIGRQVVGSFVSNGSHSSSDQAIVKQLQQASAKVNQQLPTMYDKVTRLDTTVVGPGKTWTYMYTIVSPGSTSLTQRDLNEYLGTKVRNGVCTAKFMKAFVDNGVQIKYVYRASDGTVIGSITVNPSDCKQST